MDRFDWLARIQSSWFLAIFSTKKFPNNIPKSTLLFPFFSNTMASPVYSNHSGNSYPLASPNYSNFTPAYTSTYGNSNAPPWGMPPPNTTGMRQPPGQPYQANSSSSYSSYVSGFKDFLKRGSFILSSFFDNRTLLSFETNFWPVWPFFF